MAEKIHSSKSNNSKGSQNNLRARRILFHVLRLLLGAVFLFACYDKIFNPQAFAEAVYNYQILPDAAINAAALYLPWLELLVAVCLITGFWLPGAASISTGLLAIFTGALLFNLMRGLDVHCGCFSTDISAGPADLWTVARDFSFLLVSVYLLVYTFFLKQPAAATNSHATNDAIIK